MLFCFSLTLGVLCGLSVAQIPQEPPFYGVLGQRPTVTPQPTRGPGDKDVSVRIAPGEVRGRRFVLNRLPWQPDRDWREAPKNGPNDVNSLPKESTVEVFTFLGVPYAERPIGQLRFKPPQRMSVFPQGGIDAFDFKSSCGQDAQRLPTVYADVNERPYPWLIDEDCLYLNIFTPQISHVADRTFPVVVFFHGGGFQRGTANEWPGHLLASKGLVVVTVNYRLGPFGFMTLGEWSGSNMGLLDQKVALEWVRDYIYSFNGDPQRVLLLGHGAGAASAGLHMLSPMSTNLFYAVAALSGADTSYHSVIYDMQLAFNNTIKLGRETGCIHTTATAVYNCILTRSTSDIIAATSSMRVEYNRYGFLPTVDYRFIPDLPKKILQKKLVASQVPYLTGVNEFDGTEALLEDRLLGEIDKKWTIDNNYVTSKIVRYVLQNNYTTNRDAIIQAIKYLYTYWPDPRNDDRMRVEYLKMNSDAYYVAPVQQAARMHADAGSITYMYVNNYRIGSDSLNPDQKNPYPYWMGTHHNVDLYLIFGFPWMPRELLPPTFPTDQVWTQLDRNMSDNFMETIRQFAKKKDPNLWSDNTWTNLNIREQAYMDLNITRKMKKDYDWEHVSFWNIYIDQVADLWTTTLDPTVASLKREVEILRGVSGTFIVLAAMIAVAAGALGYIMYGKKQEEMSRRLVDYQYQQPHSSIAGDKV